MARRTEIAGRVLVPRGGHIAAGVWHPEVGYLTYDLRTLDGRYGAAWAALKLLHAPAEAFDRCSEAARGGV